MYGKITAGTPVKKAFLSLILASTLMLGGCETSSLNFDKLNFSSLKQNISRIARTDNANSNQQNAPDTQGQDSKQTKAGQFAGNTNTPAASTSDELVGTDSAIQTDPAFVSPSLVKSENCPQIELVNELDGLYQFTDMDNPSENNEVSSVKITDLGYNCHYQNDNMVVEMTIRFDGEVGPKGRVWKNQKPSFSYPYFIAISTEKGDILSKDIHALTFSYNTKTNSQTQHEELRQIIPADKNSAIDHYSVLIGFQLTAKQLAYNRMLKAQEIEEKARIPTPVHYETELSQAAPMHITK